jgi:hypothetical protein
VISDLTGEAGMVPGGHRTATEHTERLRSVPHVLSLMFNDG